MVNAGSRAAAEQFWCSNAERMELGVIGRSTGRGLRKEAGRAEGTQEAGQGLDRTGQAGRGSFRPGHQGVYCSTVRV